MVADKFNHVVSVLLAGNNRKTSLYYGKSRKVQCEKVYTDWCNRRDLAVRGSLECYTDINIQSNGRCYLLFLATGVMETLVVVYLSEWIEDGKLADVLKVVGKNSFIILITHYYICRGIIVTGLKYWGIKSNTVIQLVLTILIIGVYYSIFKMIGYCKSQKMKIE